MAAVATLWMGGWIGFTLFAAAFDSTGCPGNACWEQRDRATFVMVGLQVLWLILLPFTWVRSRTRLWGFWLALVLPPATVYGITATLWPNPY